MNLNDIKPKDKTTPGARVRLNGDGWWGDASSETGTVLASNSTNERRTTAPSSSPTNTSTN